MCAKLPKFCIIPEGGEEQNVDILTLLLSLPFYQGNCN